MAKSWRFHAKMQFVRNFNVMWYIEALKTFLFWFVSLSPQIILQKSNGFFFPKKTTCINLQDSRRGPTFSRGGGGGGGGGGSPTLSKGMGGSQLLISYRNPCNLLYCDFTVEGGDRGGMWHGDILTLQWCHGSTCGQRAADLQLLVFHFIFP